MRILFTLFLVIILPFRLTIAQDSVPYSPLSKSGEKRHAGSQLALFDAQQKSSLIFVGQLEVLGNFDLTDAGVTAYRDAKVKITSFLKGALDGSNEIKITIIVMKVHPIGWEFTPTVGSSYIFFAKKNKGNKYEAIKLLEATDANITAIKNLIATSPSSK